MKLEIIRHAQFKRDWKKIKKRNLDLGKIDTVIEILANGQNLPSKHRDHALHGKWRNHRNAHITSDWILIYRIADGELQLARTGSHADLF